MTEKIIISEAKLKKLVKEKQLEFVEKTFDVQNRALIRKLFIRLGYLTYMRPDSDEIIRVKATLDEMLDEHGMHLVKYTNVTRSLLGDDSDE